MRREMGAFVSGFLNVFFPLSWVVIVFFLTGCWEQNLPKVQAKKTGESLSIMTFNVENLFDTNDDPGKSDETYLPLKKKKSSQHKKLCSAIERKKWRDQCLYWDWSKEAVEEKMKAIAKTILSYNDGKGPDIVVLQEIENKSVLEKLNNDYLKPAQYKSVVLVEGADKRGIDIAMLSRYPQRSKAVLIQIPFEKISAKRRADTRGILKASFEVGKKNVTIFGVHFPAPYHPTSMREQATKFLNRIVLQDEADIVLSAGDFNITRDEDKKYKLNKKYYEPLWESAHLKCKKCKGTNYYPPKKSWSFLDRIYLYKKGRQKATILSVEVWNKYKEQVNRYGTPKRFFPSNKLGVSDHWPLVMDLSY